MQKLTRIGLVLSLVLLSSYSLAHAQDGRGRIQVVATIFPLYDFAKEIGGDRADVALLLPPGVEPHAFEPTPADVVKISRADVFIYTGKYMEPWVENLLGGISRKELCVVDASQGVALMDEAGEESGHNLESPGHAAAAGKDPHIWLDLAVDQRIADAIAGAFEKKDSRNAAFYRENAERYKAKLALLDQRFHEAFSPCRLKTFIYAGHFAFGYFAKRYGLAYLSPYRGFSPDAEPTPRSLAELIDKMKKLHIRYIYYEELIDPKIGRIIAEETGATLLLLNAAHNVGKEDFKKGVRFISIMEENLQKLKLGLGCS